MRRNVKRRAPADYEEERTPRARLDIASILHGSGAKAAVVLLLALSLFVAASLYTVWTGSAGAVISAFLLNYIGGAFAVPLFFVIYLCVIWLVYGSVPNFLRQVCGTSVVFLLAAILLGLNGLTAQGGRYPAWLFAGKLGFYTASAIYTSVGVLGTFLVGAALLYLALLFFGITCFNHIFEHLRLPDLSLVFGRFHKNGGKTDARGGDAQPDEREGSDKNLQEDAALEEAADDSEEADDAGDDEPSEPADFEADGAPNIAEVGSGDYFGSDATEIDKPAARPVAAKHTVISTKHGDTADAVLADPDFNLADKSGSRIKQGSFPPPVEVFGPEETHIGEMNEEKALPLGEKIIKALEQFNIESNLAEILVGPTVIQFRIQLAPGIKVSRVASLSNDIALALAVPSLRIEAPIPGKPYIGIEIPNPKRRGIPLRTVVEDKVFLESKFALPLPFGIAVNGDPIVVGLEDLPHMLIAGTTGSGKSVFINSCIVGLCSMRTPAELRMILIDPKRVEMAVYDRLPHLLTPPVTDAKKAVHTLSWAIREMEDRYTTFAKARVRNIEHYNEKVIPKDRLPRIVIVVDELADLMMTAPKEVEEYICRLAQMARAVGIHLMLATQRPSVNVITGLIKANIPARVAFTLPSNADSRTIIDCAGAEKLLGKGDMLYLSTRNPKPIRIQSPWIDEDLLSGWLDYICRLFGEPQFIEIEKQGSGPDDDSGTQYDDDLLDDAVDMVMSTGIASASGLQRRLRVGFSRASRLIDMMEQIGIVGPSVGAKPREILVDEDGAKELLDDARSNG